jgi:hypothetical protein
LGHERRAQDLLYQTIRESGVALAIIAEPYNVPNATNWVQDTSGRAAITWTPGLGPHGVLLDRGDGYVRYSTQWGNVRTTPRGRWLTDWAAGNGLVLANQGTAKTCVAWRGASVVDLTWATPTLYRKIRHVAEGVETLSDHLYVYMELKLGRNNDNRSGARQAGPIPPRWRLKDRDKEAGAGKLVTSQRYGQWMTRQMTSERK